MALKIRKHDYYVSLWRWDVIKGEYFPQVITQTNSIEKAILAYDAVATNIDVPLVELWQVEEDCDKRLKYKIAGFRYMGFVRL